MGQHRCRRLQRGVERVQRRQPHVAARIVHVGQQPVDCVRLRSVARVERHLDGGRGLRVERLPGRHRGRVAFAESALLGLGEHVIAIAALGGQVVAVGRHLGSGEQLTRSLIIQRQPLQLEEAQRVSGLHDGRVNRRPQVAVLLAGDVHRLPQHRVGGDPRQLVLDHAQLRKRLGQLCCCHGCHAAPPGGFERPRPFQRRGDRLVRGARGVEQRGQIPVDA